MRGGDLDPIDEGTEEQNIADTQDAVQGAMGEIAKYVAQAEECVERAQVSAKEAVDAAAHFQDVARSVSEEFPDTPRATAALDVSQNLVRQAAAAQECVGLAEAKYQQVVGIAQDVERVHDGILDAENVEQLSRCILSAQDLSESAQACIRADPHRGSPVMESGTQWWADQAEGIKVKIEGIIDQHNRRQQVAEAREVVRQVASEVGLDERPPQVAPSSKEGGECTVSFDKEEDAIKFVKEAGTSSPVKEQGGNFTVELSSEKVSQMTKSLDNPANGKPRAG